jgi:IS5 family transposase
MCETIRVFLRDVRKADPKAYGELAGGLLERHGEESRYADARKEQRPRRLEVVARDVGRLRGAFEKNEAVKGTEGWKLLERLFQDQCRPTRAPRKPKKRDDDHGDGEVAVELKPATEIASDSLQSPHDPEVTYSGHKGKGYSAQVQETCLRENAVQLITAVALTPACESDAKATVPMVRQAQEAGLGPEELVADTAFSGAKNAAELAKQGVQLLAPTPGPEEPQEKEASTEPVGECPQDFHQAGKWLRRQEASAEFPERYAIRSGIEATNSELKRKHGLGRLRVRGVKRVALALYFKALACNVKRALKFWLAPRREGALTPA